MSLSPAFLDELRGRTSLSALVGRTVKLTRAGREQKACCPFHPEKSPSFYVNDDKGFYHCFGCGAHGDAIRWMTDQQGLPFIDAVKELAAAAGMEMPALDPRAREKAERAATLNDVTEAAAAFFRAELGGLGGAAGRDYLQRRTVSDATASAFTIGFAPDSRTKLRQTLEPKFGLPRLIEAGLVIEAEGKEPYDRFRGRLMIPIRDPRGRVIAFGGRILDSGEPKYLNSPDTPLFDKGRTLFNLDRAAAPARKANRVIVVEGYMDVIALAQAGIAEAVAPLGTALTEAQLDRLWRLGVPPILCFDGDAAGQRAAVRAATRALPMLAPERTLCFATLPAGQDPDDLVRAGGRAAFDALAAAPEPLVDLLWRHERDASNLASPEGRAGLKERLLGHAQTIEHNSLGQEYRREFLDRFYEEFGWKAKHLKVIEHSIVSTYRIAMNVQLAESFLRSAIYGLSRFPEVASEHMESVGLLRINDSGIGKWRDDILEAVVERPHLEADAAATISTKRMRSPIRRHIIGFDARFGLALAANDNRAAKQVAQLVEALVQEPALVSELARLNHLVEGAFSQDRYAELEGHRQVIRMELARLNQRNVDAGERETEANR